MGDVGHGTFFWSLLGLLMLHGSLVGRSLLIPRVGGGLLVRGLPWAGIPVRLSSRCPGVAHGFGSLVTPLVSLLLLGWCSSPRIASGVAWLSVAAVLCLRGALSISVRVVSIGILAIGGAV